MSDAPPRFKMSGSQTRTAFALRHNVKTMVAAAGVDCVGFLTLTVGDKREDGSFEQVKDSAEASRRVNNLNRRVLRDLFERAVIVTERHKSGAIHFHVVGVLRGRPDIRTGLDWDRVARRDYRSAGEELRGIWAMLRETLPKYGFGRAELLPIRKTGEAVAAYVSKYIEKNLENRPAEDKGKKLVRYLGWEKRQLKPSEFGWATPRARAWRGRAASTAAVISCRNREDCAEELGPRWAFLLTMVFTRIHEPGLSPELNWTTPQRMAAFESLRRFTRGWRRPYEEASWSHEVIERDTLTEHDELYERDRTGHPKDVWRGMVRGWGVEWVGGRVGLETHPK